ncbi:tRNA pseudouridine(55) synthase TruB [bacterium]|nr:tRNA pseudouridine(55) synthase TruB [bacterium]
MKEGFILIDKPKGITSHDVVDKLREITKIRKIGYAGTLDPLGTGLLILGIGRGATRRLSEFLRLDKEYIAKLRLGAISDTFDKEGKIEFKKIEKIPSREKIGKVIKEFIGQIYQIPPSYSAKKIKGEKAYNLARKGRKVELKPQKVNIYKIKILRYKFPYLEIKVNCSSGTYIRSLASDIGKRLGCGALLEELRRTRIGNFSVKQAKKLEEINSKNWKSFLTSLQV